MRVAVFIIDRMVHGVEVIDSLEVVAFSEVVVVAHLMHIEAAVSFNLGFSFVVALEL